jgi:O-antigen/teichoic acid export membrane protein
MGSRSIRDVGKMTTSQIESRQVTSRLIRGIGASALGPIVTAAIQLGSVPLLIHAWGAAKYGDWLLISAIPSYLTFTDLGFGSSSGSDMTMRVAAGDWEGALATFQSSWALLCGLSLVVLAALAALVWWAPWQPMLHLGAVTNRQAAYILLTLAAWILAVQQWSILESGYRCDGNFALGNFCSTSQRLIEAVVATVLGVTTGSFLAVSLSYLGLRLLGLVCFRFLLKRKSPWLTLGFENASVPAIRRMLKPSFGFIALPLGTAVSIQGFTLVIGVLLGPVAVAAFATARTLTRAGMLMINTIATGTWPEFSSAFGAGNLSLARNLHRHAYQASLILALGSAGLLWAFGPSFYDVWVRKSVALDLACFHILLLVTIANSLWFVSATVQMSANKHSRLAMVYLGATIASCGLGYGLVGRFGLTGSAMALLAIEIAMCAFVLRTTLKQMQDTPREFFRAVFGSVYFVRPLLQSRFLR